MRAPASGGHEHACRVAPQRQHLAGRPPPRGAPASAACRVVPAVGPCYAAGLLGWLRAERQPPPAAAPRGCPCATHLVPLLASTHCLLLRPPPHRAAAVALVAAVAGHADLLHLACGQAALRGGRRANAHHARTHARARQARATHASGRLLEPRPRGPRWSAPAAAPAFLGCTLRGQRPARAASAHPCAGAAADAQRAATRQSPHAHARPEQPNRGCAVGLGARTIAAAAPARRANGPESKGGLHLRTTLH